MQQDVAKCTYPGQPAEEITQRVFYKSFVMVMPIILACVLIGIAALAGMAYGAAHPELVIDDKLPVFSGSVISLIAFLVLVFDGLLAFGAVWIWRNNRILVTNEHIVDIDQNTLFHRSVSTLTLSRIQDVHAEVDGPAQTLLQYGTIIVQTAGEKQNFSFDYMPDPYEAEQYVLKVHKEYMARHGETDGLRDAEIAEAAKNPLEAGK